MWDNVGQFRSLFAYLDLRTKLQRRAAWILFLLQQKRKKAQSVRNTFKHWRLMETTHQNLERMRAEYWLSWLVWLKTLMTPTELLESRRHESQNNRTWGRQLTRTPPHVRTCLKCTKKKTSYACLGWPESFAGRWCRINQRRFFSQNLMQTIKTLYAQKVQLRFQGTRLCRFSRCQNALETKKKDAEVQMELCHIYTRWFKKIKNKNLPSRNYFINARKQLVFFSSYTFLKLCSNLSWDVAGHLTSHELMGRWLETGLEMFLVKTHFSLSGYLDHGVCFFASAVKTPEFTQTQEQEIRLLLRMDALLLY